MNSIGKLLMVIGLPDAGMTHLIEKKLQPRITGVLVHDFHGNAIDHSSLPRNSRHYDALIESLRNGNDCLIADIEFCRPRRRKAVIEAVIEEFPEVKIEYHCFKNQPERCKTNARRRGRKGVDEEIAKIEKISEDYEIPAEAIEYDVYEGPVPSRLLRILSSIENKETARFPATEIFNEGWMLRLLLDALQEYNNDNHPLQFSSQSTWYSEARLTSPFHPRVKGDPLGEGFTHADGVIGHFQLDPNTRAGLRLDSEAKQFMIVEAKMFSNLSRGTRNAPDYDQAARNVACMAEAIMQAGVPVSNLDSVAFYVVAPEQQFRSQRGRATNLEELVDPLSIRKAVERRIIQYENLDRPESQSLRVWQKEWLEPLIDRMVNDSTLNVLSWEDMIHLIVGNHSETGEELTRFFSRCMEQATRR